VGNLHVDFTIVVYSPTNITSLFYPVSKFSNFCICDTPFAYLHTKWHLSLSSRLATTDMGRKFGAVSI